MGQHIESYSIHALKCFGEQPWNTLLKLICYVLMLPAQLLDIIISVEKIIIILL
jgi:hypothetical protein